MARLSTAGRLPIGSLSAHGSGMRKLLRCKRTKAFLARNGSWTRDMRRARILSERGVPDGIRACFRPGELEIYYSFGDSRESRYDFTVAVY
jgi:hypothetical protein